MIGCELAGGFLRAHGQKGPTESLNSPGAVFKKLCVTDLKVDLHGRPMENVYGWVAKISSLAVGREAAEMGVAYTDFNVDGSKCSMKKQ
jgi:glutamate--cysteine ligase